MVEDLEKEPTDSQEKRFEKTEVLGDAKVEEYSGIEEKLSPNEKVRLFAALKTDKGDKNLLALTQNRLLTFSNPKIKLLGEKERFKDIGLNNIEEMDVEERKGFDTLTVRTSKDKRKFMVPEQTGVRISGEIRELQSKQNVDPAEQLEKLGEEKNKGNLSSEEYNEKKDELIDRI